MSRTLGLLCGLWVTSCVAALPTVVVSGATGRVGLYVYQHLKAKGVVPRALVRNATKAKELLDCGACTEAEGIFVVDITKPASMPAKAFQGADTLIICTASQPRTEMNYTYGPGADPHAIDYEGTVNQVKVALENGIQRIGYLSTADTTAPGQTIDLWGGNTPGYVKTYHLVAEAYIMNAVLGVDNGSFTIVKATGLLNNPGGKNLLLVYHNDETPTCPSKTQCYGIMREDVAIVMVAAVTDHRASGANVRFDVASDLGTPAPKQVDWDSFFAEAKHVVSVRQRTTIV